MCFIETHKGHDDVEFAKIDDIGEEIVKNKVEENAANIDSKYQEKDDGIRAEIIPIATIATDYDLLRRVVCVGHGEAWIIVTTSSLNALTHADPCRKQSPLQMTCGLMIYQ